MDFEKIRETVESLIEANFNGPDKTFQSIAKSVSIYALAVTIECLKEYHKQIENDLPQI